MALVFLPPASGAYDQECMRHCVTTREVIPRESAVATFAGCWDGFHHLGDILSVSEVHRAAEGKVASTLDFTKYDVKIHGGEDDYFVETARSAMPAGCDPTATARVMPGDERRLPIVAVHGASLDAVRAMPCGPATKPLRVTAWLIDSGTP